VPVAVSALPRPALPCFLDPESSDFNGLLLIYFRLARTYARLRHVLDGRASFPAKARN